VHISVAFLLITFFGCIFSKLFQRIRNQREILQFLIPIMNFLIKFFLLLLALFVHFDCKCLGNGSKNGKSFFMYVSYRILLGTHQRVCITKLFKLLYPNAYCIFFSKKSTVLDSQVTFCDFEGQQEGIIGQIQSPWLGEWRQIWHKVKVDSDIGLPMVNV
jgi:hypothetical protein